MNRVIEVPCFGLKAILSPHVASSRPFQVKSGQRAIRERKRPPLVCRYTPTQPDSDQPASGFRSLIILAMFSTLFGGPLAATADEGEPMSKVKGYLVSKLERMDTAAHDFVTNANAYQAVID